MATYAARQLASGLPETAPLDVIERELAWVTRQLGTLAAARGERRPSPHECGLMQYQVALRTRLDAADTTDTPDTTYTARAASHALLAAPAA